MSNVIPANFSISPAAKREIENIRSIWNAQFCDRAAIAMIGWGIFMPSLGKTFEDVVVSFYGASQVPAIAEAVQTVSGLPVVFFTTEQYRDKFDGKVLDHAGQRGFFLRDP